MSKYNIVSKHPTGMQPNKIYELEYQIREQPELYKVKMICIMYNGSKRLAFLEGKYHELNTSIERDTFIKEIQEFQKGASYRRTHPIAKTKKQILLNQIKELQDQLYEIEKEEHKKIIKEYDSLVKDNEELNNIEDSLKTLFNSYRYMIKDHDFNSTFSKAVLYDRMLKLPVKVIFFGLNEMRDLTDEEKVKVMKLK